MRYRSTAIIGTSISTIVARLTKSVIYVTRVCELRVTTGIDMDIFARDVIVIAATADDDEASVIHTLMSQLGYVGHTVKVEKVEKGYVMTVMV